jgi:23S rRNA (cytidine1920-2'-O)/16S rRNA (cytidine1409-2'-O)-methyltransferase
VLVGGSPTDKPSRLVSPAEPVVLTGAPARFVSRGGEKLEAALAHFALDVRDRRALDAGVSTGGFTDCLLQRGARHVVAVDVGYGQLHERLRDDPRITLLERTNIRGVTPDDVGGPADIVVADLSFISLRTVATPLVALTAPDGDLVVLVKPQFEAGRAEVSRGKGVITDPAVRDAAVRDVSAAFTVAGAAMIDVMASPITGAQGNVEFLLHLRPPQPESAP